MTFRVAHVFSFSFVGGFLGFGWPGACVVDLESKVSAKVSTTHVHFVIFFYESALGHLLSVSLGCQQCPMMPTDA